MCQNAKGCILVVQDQETTALLRQSLSVAGYHVLDANSGEEAFVVLMEFPVDLIITDSDLPGVDGYTFCRQLRQREMTRELPIMMLSKKSSADDKVAGFEAGVDDYITKPFEPVELLHRIKVLVARHQKRQGHVSPPPTRGHIVALFGTKGGVGRTTVGVNLAVALQRKLQGRVALVDADFFFGDIALHLGLSPSHTILDLISRIDRIDEEVLDQVLIPHSSGLRVLISPRDPEDVELITPAHLSRLLDILAAHFDYVVVDCQGIYDERTLTTLERADAILLLIKPEVACVKNMAVFSELAAKLKMPFDRKIHIVLNRANSKSGIGAKEIERIFRRQIAFQIASGGNAVVVSVNRGVPLVIDQPNHPFSVQVNSIADHILRTLPTLQPA